MRIAVAIVIILLTLVIVGGMDSRDSESEFTHYCNMVMGGYWPDYKGLAEHCEG